MHLGAYIYTTEKIFTGLEVLAKTPHISNKQHYKKERWKHIEKEYKPVRYKCHKIAQIKYTNKIQ